MRYVGIQSQISSNNMKSTLLLIAFPIILLGMTWVFLAAINYFSTGYYDEAGYFVNQLDSDSVNWTFTKIAPFIIGGVAIWFAIAYFSNTKMIQHATGAQPLMRRENPRVYNIVENLCMAGGMEMPKVNVIDDPQLNAFASGIDKNSYTVTVTTGLLDRLNDEELAGVIGHELTHIRNRDTRLLITSIIFVGIISTVLSLVVRMIYNRMWFGGFSSSNDRNSKSNGLSTIVILLIGAACAAIAYLFIMLTRFAISRKREFMADAGGAELCGNPQALASALRKISDNPGLGDVEREDIAQMYIIHPKQLSQGLMQFLSGLFATHPSTEERIRILEQF
ncbi:MAG: M48 family metallopeptidase [Prevotella sp.]|nr:M48 family metallopeptidase [Prevotella sp.]